MTRRACPKVNCPRRGCLSVRTRVLYTRWNAMAHREERHRKCLACGWRWITHQPPEQFFRNDVQDPV